MQSTTRYHHGPTSGAAVVPALLSAVSLLKLKIQEEHHTHHNRKPLLPNGFLLLGFPFTIDPTTYLLLFLAHQHHPSAVRLAAPPQQRPGGGTPTSGGIHTDWKNIRMVPPLTAFSGRAEVRL